MGVFYFQKRMQRDIFGCLRTWLKCMSGRSPKAIITNEFMAIWNEVGQAFPNSTHRLCLWHIIIQKIPEKLGWLTEWRFMNLTTMIKGIARILKEMNGWRIVSVLCWNVLCCLTRWKHKCLPLVVSCVLQHL